MCVEAIGEDGLYYPGVLSGGIQFPGRTDSIRQEDSLGSDSFARIGLLARHDHR